MSRFQRNEDYFKAEEPARTAPKVQFTPAPAAAPAHP